MAIEHDLNGPYVRAARGATVLGQTEIVYALRVEYMNGDVEYWNARHTPFSEETIRSSRDYAYKWQKPENRVRDFRPVQRSVTIAATDWR